jgi:predicted Zn-dependent protease
MKQDLQGERLNRVRWGWWLGSLVGLLLTVGTACALAVEHPKGEAKPPAVSPAAEDTKLIETMSAELARAMKSLGSPASADGKVAAQPKPYFISYSVSDAESVSMAAEFGALVDDSANHRRTADIQVRLGSGSEDNTHGAHRNSGLTTIPLPLTDDGAALTHSLWYATNRGYGRALDSLLQVKTEQAVRAKEEDSSPDFSSEKPVDALIPADARFTPTSPLMKDQSDKAEWAARLRELSGLFKQFPEVFYNDVSLQASNEMDYFVSSEGTRVSTPSHVARLVIVGRTRAADGMDLYRVETFESDELGRLPDQKKLIAKTLEMGRNLEALRVAPVTEPFDGPAILSGRATAVFFHEVLGHRLEGQRQRGDEEGQTFTKMLNKPIMPSFISVSDDPTLTQFGGVSLSGHYLYDDEGQAARRVDLIQDGVLKTFLMSRLPIASFSQSNGHGRAESGHMPSGRQGNLIVSSSKTVTDAELREMLRAEAKKQGKAYGLYFEDISSGFAVTTRSSPQAFSVVPLVVYRVFVDGRPDELVRGVSIVGTPQTALKDILATGDKPDVFNGICGAESGSIPVSAVAPAMLLSKIETQRQKQGTARPPLVPPPSGAAEEKQ